MYQLELLDTAWIMLIGIFRHVICLNIVPWCRPISGDGTGPSVTRLSSDSPRQWESVSLRLRAERPRRSQQNTVIIEWRAKAYRVRHLKPRQLNSPTFLQLALCIVIASKNNSMIKRYRMAFGWNRFRWTTAILRLRWVGQVGAIKGPPMTSAWTLPSPRLSSMTHFSTDKWCISDNSR